MAEKAAAANMASMPAPHATVAEEDIKLEERRSPELVFGMVGPVGSGVTTTADILEALLIEEYGYEVHRHKVSDIIKECASLVEEQYDPNLKGAARIDRLQTIGNKLRAKFSSNYLVEKCVERIAIGRLKGGYSEQSPTIPLRRRQAHLIDSLKNPAEVRLLQDVYGDIFWAITVFCPEDVREKRLKRDGAKEDELPAIMKRDENEELPHGQKVRDTSFLADFFVRNDHESRDAVRPTLQRYLEILFNVKVHTPHMHEAAMYTAATAASKSACLSRQVGAAIQSEKGELIGIGWNDVPTFGGGLYVEDSPEQDHRCYRWGNKICHNDHHKSALYDKVIAALDRKGLLAADADPQAVRSALATTDIRNLIEFSRAVHAEMEAIISVARMNKDGLVGATMLTTTFPCHSCARHIVASGIKKVIYIEPYAKSLAIDLHDDAVSIDRKDENSKVVFLQYEGVAPKNIIKLFKHGATRKMDGKAKELEKRVAEPVFLPAMDGFAAREQMIVKRLKTQEESARKNA